MAYPDGDEALARLLFYGDYIRQGDPEKELAARIYAVLSRLVPPDELTSAFMAFWGSFSQDLRVAHEAALVSQEPLLGRDAFWRRKTIERETYLNNARDWFLQFWRHSGQGAERALGDVVQQEQAMNRITRELAYFPSATDAEIASRVRERVMQKGLRNDAMIREMGGVQNLRTWLQARVPGMCASHEEAVREGRRRLARSDLGRHLAELETQWAARRLTPAQRDLERHAVLDPLYRDSD